MPAARQSPREELVNACKVLYRAGIVDRAAQREIVERFIARLGIRCTGPGQPIR